MKYIMRLTRQPAFTTWVKPIVLIGTTPRPTKLIKELKADPQVITTTVSSFTNAANLNSKFIAELNKIAGTRMGRQELFAELLEDNPNGVDGFTHDIFEETRINDPAQINDILANLVKVVVALDPAAKSNENSDETGIIVAGKDENGHGYVIKDATFKGTPLEWAQKAVNLYNLHNANMIVAEVNQGGEMVETVIRSVNRRVPITAVHATRGKQKRAEPVGALYAQRLIHHLGHFPELEDQMVNFNTEIGADQQKSPDRMDALVWAFTYLLVDNGPPVMPMLHVF